MDMKFINMHINTAASQSKRIFFFTTTSYRYADFYIRWARELEDRGAIVNAREILHKGRLQGAIPTNVDFI